MEVLNLVLVVFILVAPIGVGAYAILFSRRFSLALYRSRKAVWKIGFTETDVRVGQVFVVVIGAVVLIGGLVVAGQLLFP